MKILLITDAWFPQTNGVVTTLSNLVQQARANGDRVYVFHPRRCLVRFPLPFYREIEIGFPNPFTVFSLLKRNTWDCIHIATPEGTLGISFSLAAFFLRVPYSCSCHTKFPEFVNEKFPFISTKLGWFWMRVLYSGTKRIITTTESMVAELKHRGFKQEIHSWTRGVDRSIFFSDDRQRSETILLSVGRVSIEKNLDEFCQLDIPGTRKVMVGDGPLLPILREKYPDVEFVGMKKGMDLAEYYHNASVFVFTSKNDTFGIVNIEAISCGTPVAAYDVTGPKDIIENGVTGHVSDDLKQSIQECLKIDRETVSAASAKWTWEECYEQFKRILISKTG